MCEIQFCNTVWIAHFTNIVLDVVIVEKIFHACFSETVISLFLRFMYFYLLIFGKMYDYFLSNVY